MKQLNSTQTASYLHVCIRRDIKCVSEENEILYVCQVSWCKKSTVLLSVCQCCVVSFLKIVVCCTYCKASGGSIFDL